MCCNSLNIFLILELTGGLTFNVRLNRNHRPRIRLVSDSFIIRFHDPSTAAAVTSISSSRSWLTSLEWHISPLISTSCQWHRLLDVDSANSMSTRTIQTQTRLAKWLRLATSVPSLAHPVLLQLTAESLAVAGTTRPLRAFRAVDWQCKISPCTTWAAAENYQQAKGPQNSTN